eukprot:10928703-Karenia_brevis.AAC.1
MCIRDSFEPVYTACAPSGAAGVASHATPVLIGGALADLKDFNSQKDFSSQAGAASPVLFEHAFKPQERVVTKRFATAGHASPASASVLFDATIKEEATTHLKDFKSQNSGA